MKRLSVIIGGSFVGLVVLAALVSFFWTPYDPTQVMAAERLQPPSADHLMGTDGFGIDIFSRIMVGARSALLVGIVSVAIAAAIGVPLGIISGMSNKVVATVISRATDILYAFPAILLAILLAAALGGSTMTGMVAIGVSTIPVFTRVARAGTLQVMSQDFITAARASGTCPVTIAIKHVWTNISPLIGVQASVSFGMALLSEAALSYLGLSTPPTTPTWGRMLYDAQKYLLTDPNLTVWPALAIALAVMGFNVLGDGMREYLDPRLREVR